MNRATDVLNVERFLGQFSFFWTLVPLDSWREDQNSTIWTLCRLRNNGARNSIVALSAHNELHSEYACWRQRIPSTHLETMDSEYAEGSDREELLVGFC